MILSGTIMHIHSALYFSVGLGPAAFPRGRWYSGYAPPHGGGHEPEEPRASCSLGPFVSFLLPMWFCFTGNNASARIRLMSKMVG